METTTSPVLTAPVNASTSAEVPVPVAPTRAISLLSLLLSASAILLGMGPLAVGGIVAGFVARRDEPAHRAMSTWGIALGFVALFGWLVLALVGVAAFLPLWLAGTLGN